jgi:hypothetical protein
VVSIFNGKWYQFKPTLKQSSQLALFSILTEVFNMPAMSLQISSPRTKMLKEA